MGTGRGAATGSPSISSSIAPEEAAGVVARTIFLNTVTCSHQGRAVVTIHLVAMVKFLPFVVSKVMTLTQAVVVVSLLLPPVMAFLVSVVMLSLCPVAYVFLCCVATEDKVTMLSSVVSHITVLHSASVLMVLIEIMPLPAGVLVLVYLPMHCGTSQQLLHLTC